MSFNKPFILRGGWDDTPPVVIERAVPPHPPKKPGPQSSYIVHVPGPAPGKTWDQP